MAEVEQMSETPEHEAPRFSEIPIFLFIRGITLLVVLLSVIISLHYYLGTRLIRDAGIAEPMAGWLWLALWAAFGSVFMGFIGGRLLPRSVSGVVQWVGFGWMGTFGVLLSATVASDLVLLVARQLTAVDASWLAYRAVVVGAITVPTLAVGAMVARSPKLKRFSVDIPGLGRELDGLRVVQLTDVHIGETLRRRFAQKLVERVNALDADVIAITGDLVDGSVKRLRDEVAPLAGLKGRSGVFFVSGNHEFYNGGASWEVECRRLGMTVLHNEHRVIEKGSARLIIGGVTDLEGARFAPSFAPDVTQAFAGAPEGPRLLLAHQPRFARLAAGHHVALQLSGHTHGGQIFPFMFMVRLQQPVISGMRTLYGVLTYTSKGTGYWGPPFRVGPRGEITEITLRSAPAPAV